MRSSFPIAAVAALWLAFGVAGGAASADDIAVFGNNGLDNYINGFTPHTATVVSNAQIATPGFLSSFDVFLYTRDGSSFGSSLTAAAAAAVQSFVGAGSNVVLFNSDLADEFSPNGATNANTGALFTNALDFALQNGAGYIGEFTGTFAALDSNGQGFTPLALISGTAGFPGFGGGGSNGSMVLTPVGTGHPVTNGVAFPFNPSAVEFGATINGVDPSLVLATWSGTNNPAIIAATKAAVDVGSAFMMLPSGGLFPSVGNGGHFYGGSENTLINLSFLGNLGGAFPGNIINFVEDYDFNGVTLNTSGQEYGFFAGVDAVGFSPHTYSGDPLPVDTDVQFAIEAGMEAIRNQDPIALAGFPELVGFNEPGELAVISAGRLVEYFAQFNPNDPASPEFATFDGRMAEFLFNVDFNTLDFTEDAAQADGEDILFPHFPFDGIGLNISINFSLTQGGGIGAFSGDSQVVPEPSTLALLAAGLAGVIALRRRRKKRAA